MTALARLLMFAGALQIAANAAAQSELEVLPVQGNVYMIAGAGGNTTVQVGPGSRGRRRYQDRGGCGAAA